MENKMNGDKEAQLLEHSLPGTNMAGKGPGSDCEREEQNKQATDNSRPQPREGDKRGEDNKF